MKGSGVWNPGAPEPKHGDYRPGSFKVQGQVGAAMWQTAHQRWCASCKGWKPVAGVTGNLVCPDCKATWTNAMPGRVREMEPEATVCGESCNCPLCQPYIPEN